MNERNPWMKLAVDNDKRLRDCSAERYELKRRLENAAAVCRYLRGEVERLGKMAAMADEVCPKCGCTFYYDEHGWTHEVTHE